MKVKTAALAAATGMLLALPASAGAALTELGVTPGETFTPSCPGSPCLAVSRTTGYQAKVGDSRAVDVIPEDGRIVAWGITLGNPGAKQTDFFNSNLGGESQAQLTVLRPGNRLYSRVLAQGDPQKLAPYFGSTVQFALDRSLPVKKGNVIGLTVPTWAPALMVNQPGTSSWRATRAKGQCDDFDAATAQTGTGGIARAYCLYRTARLTYSFTFVPDPKPVAGAATTTTPAATTTTPAATTTTPAATTTTPSATATATTPATTTPTPR